MKILHIIDALQMGGAENLLGHTIAELTEHEHLVVTVFAHNDLSLLPVNATHKSLGVKHKAALFFSLPAYRKLLRHFAPDVVHAHLYFATVLAKAGTPSRIPLLFTQHFEFSKNITKVHYAWVDRWFSNKHQTCIAVSNVVLQDYVKTTGFKGQTTVLGIFIPDRYFSLAGKRDLSGDLPNLKLVALGNIKPIKNQRYLLDAFALAKDLPVSCDVYGEGQERETLEREARTKGLPVFFKGAIADSSTVLPLYDAYIMPSLSEGFPLALFEAMAAGLPAIVSDIPVFHELLGEQGDYISLPDPASVRNILLNYLAQPQLLLQKGEGLRKLAAEKASRKVYLQGLRFIYKQAIQISLKNRDQPGLRVVGD
jgi:glycosyltransferase involved in cell wall biosynthesis